MIVIVNVGYIKEGYINVVNKIESNNDSIRMDPDY
jgi:hypothetical protein